MRERMQGEVDRVERVLNAVLERVPSIEATLMASTGQPARTRKSDA